MAEDIIAMVETLDRGSLRGLSDRAMLLVGFAGGLRHSEIVGLDLKADQTEDGRSWIRRDDPPLSAPQGPFQGEPDQSLRALILRLAPHEIKS